MIVKFDTADALMKLEECLDIETFELELPRAVSKKRYFKQLLLESKRAAKLEFDSEWFKHLATMFVKATYVKEYEFEDKGMKALKDSSLRPS